jgi:hypothetical protein
VLRSVAAAALLSVAGLGVPAGDPDAELQLGDAGGQASERAAARATPIPDGAALAPGVVCATWLTGLTLRNFSGDAPLENKSAFAVEMEDTA